MPNSVDGFYLTVNVRETERERERKKEKTVAGGQKESDRDGLKKISPLRGSHQHPDDPLHLVILVVRVPLKNIESNG